MKTLILALVLTVSAFGQGRWGRVPTHHSQFPYRIVVPRPTVVVSPSPWGARWGVYMPWGVPGYYPPTLVYSPPPKPPKPPNPCRKEKLKDANGRKHEILVCRQPDGRVVVYQNHGDGSTVEVKPDYNVTEIDPSNPSPQN